MGITIIINKKNISERAYDTNTNHRYPDLKKDIFVIRFPKKFRKNGRCSYVYMYTKGRQNKSLVMQKRIELSS